MINNVTLVGRLTKNPDLRYTGSGIAVANLTIAVDRSYTNSQGERETDFINCVAWRGLAETIANLAVKGSLVGITGRIQTRNYENQQGQRVYVTEISVDNFQMLEPKRVTDDRRQNAGDTTNDNYGGQQQNNYQYNSNQSYNGNSYGGNQSANNPFAGADFSDDPFEKNDDITDISDDDLPF